MKPKFEIGQKVFCYTYYNQDISVRKKTIARIIISKVEVRYEMDSEASSYPEASCFSDKEEFCRQVTEHLNLFLEKLGD